MYVYKRKYFIEDKFMIIIELIAVENENVTFYFTHIKSIILLSFLINLKLSKKIKKKKEKFNLLKTFNKTKD